MSAQFRIVRIESTSGFVLYHLDSPKQGHTAIASLRGRPCELAPTLASLYRNREGFDFEIEPGALPTEVVDDPRLRTACCVRSLTLNSG